MKESRKKYGKQGNKLGELGRLSLSLNIEVANTLRRLAEEQNQSISSFTNEVLMKALKKELKQPLQKSNEKSNDEDKNSDD